MASVNSVNYYEISLRAASQIQKNKGVQPRFATRTTNYQKQFCRKSVVPTKPKVPMINVSLNIQTAPTPSTFKNLLKTYIFSFFACQIILKDRTYSDACTVLGLPSLHDRRHKLYQRLFQQLARSIDNSLRYLLTDMRDSIITNRLRSANKIPLIFAKTNKSKNSFICYGLSHHNFNCVTLSYFCLLFTV